MQLALGDALAIALLESRGFTAEDFHILHPGGKLGASLHFVRDIMHLAMPLSHLSAAEASMSEAIMVITEKGSAASAWSTAAGKLVGIITDGDLRRHLTGHTC